MQQLRDRSLGLLTNHTGRAANGVSTLGMLREMQLGVRALFSPEHGVEGRREGHIESGETADALPIHSLYGETRRPTAAMLQGIEVLICDLQDVGARFYTYASTLANCLEECAARGIAVVVLDRPNPLGGEVIEGPRLDKKHHSFVGCLDVPVRHAMTMGELARLFTSDAGLEVELHVAQVLGWRREMLWPQTELEWPVPSPNLPNFASALWYPGTCLLEFSGVSVGRGTEAPFQIVGAPWMDAGRVLAELENEPAFTASFSGELREFTPTRGEHQGALCRGLKFSSRNADDATQLSVPLGLALLSTLHGAVPAEFDEARLRAALPLLGSEEVLEMLRAREVSAAVAKARADADAFRKRGERFLLYGAARD